MNGDFDFILKNVEINVNTAVRRAAVEIGDLIHKDFIVAINKFYNSYKPKVYSRTYSLYQGEKGVGGRQIYQRQLSKNNYECGIYVDASNYMGNPYIKNPPHGLEMDPSIVFPSAWDKGVHGFTSHTITLQHRNASKENYWHIRRNSAPPKDTPPSRRMKDSFKKIDNYGFVSGVIGKYIKSLGGL